MSNRVLLVLIGVVIALMLSMFVWNFIGFMQFNVKDTYINPYDVRGSEVYHNGTPYTLNFEQQTVLLEFLNGATSFSPKAPSEKGTKNDSIQKIVIYRFHDLPPVEITPVSYVEGNMVFSAPVWEEKGFLMEHSGGKLKQLLSQTYDH